MSRAEKLERLRDLYEQVGIVATVEQLDSIYSKADIDHDIEILEDTLRNC